VGGDCPAAWLARSWIGVPAGGSGFGSPDVGGGRSAAEVI